MRNPIVRKITVTAILAAVAALLQMLEFPVPLVPSFIKMDLSELPALLVSFAVGPLWGGAVCLVKNLVHLPMTSSFGVGELCNFLLGLALVLPAGYLYRAKHTRSGALIACACGTLCMGLLSFPINYFISYPIYCSLFGGEANVVAAYQAILPSVGSLPACLAIFNIPFTLVKGFLVSAIVFLVYKRLSGLLKGR